MRSRVVLAVVALALFVAQAWRGAGYFHADEYFQTVELASYKLGVTRASELPWEFDARIRPFLQPGAYVAAARGLALFGVEGRGATLLAFRLCGALLAWMALCLLAVALGGRVKDERGRTLLLAGCLLTWYVPYLSARTSSENLSGSMLALALASWLLLVRRPLLGAVFAGLALGIAFDLRYQTAFTALGFAAWLALVRRERLPALAMLAVGFIAAAGLGFAVDRWGYGEWTATPWNYLRVNLIEGKARQWGSQPATFYLAGLLGVHPPLSGLLLAAVVLFWLRAPKDPITWMTLPFAFGHAILAHKELRFLFPLGPLAAAIPPLLLVDPGIRLERLRGWFARHPGVLRAAALLDLAFLAALVLVPIRHDVSPQAALHDRLVSRPGTKVALLRTEPYADGPLPLAYLRPPGFAPVQVASWAEVAALADAGGPVDVVARLADLPPPEFRERYAATLLAAPLPERVARALAKAIGRTGMVALWSVERRPPRG